MSQAVSNSFHRHPSGGKKNTKNFRAVLPLFAQKPDVSDFLLKLLVCSSIGLGRFASEWYRMQNVLYLILLCVVCGWAVVVVCMCTWGLGGCECMCVVAKNNFTVPR